MTKWISNFPSWIMEQLGIVNRGGDYRPHLLDTVVPVVVIEEDEEGDDLFSDSSSSDAFAGRVNVAAVAAQLAHAQLKNPSTSPKVAFLDSIIIANPAAGGEIFIWGMKDTDLTTDVLAVNPKDSDGAAGSCHVRSQTDVASLLDSVLGSVQLLGGTSTGGQILFKPPVRLSAGSGFAVRGSTVNQGLAVTFELREYVG